MNELEQLLTASITIERLKTESKLAADAICALSQENALLKARLRIADMKLEGRVRWPINDLGANV